MKLYLLLGVFVLNFGPCSAVKIDDRGRDLPKFPEKAADHDRSVVILNEHHSLQGEDQDLNNWDELKKLKRIWHKVGTTGLKNKTADVKRYPQKSKHSKFSHENDYSDKANPFRRQWLKGRFGRKRR